MSRAAQGTGVFEPGDPLSGYYNDLTIEVLRHGTPAGGHAALARMSADRRLANPISIAQLGLGSLQAAEIDSGWLGVAALASQWIANELDPDGRLAFRFGMPHTFELPVPWYSSMAQGEAASLLVRAARVFSEHGYADAAARAGLSLVDPALGLVSATPEGPVLQEYPTSPPAHVLNGWIFSIWGLYDLSLALPAGHAGRDDAAAAFDEGVRALASRLPLYETGRRWSRYDLFPHRIVHVASPFYHRLHVAQLRATARIRPDLEVFTEVADRWEKGVRDPLARSTAVSRKIAFRMLNPRHAIV